MLYLFLGGKVFCTNMEIMSPTAGSMLPTTINSGSFCVLFIFSLGFASSRVHCLDQAQT